MRQAEEIAQEIWALADQEISCACPFFALACSFLKTAADDTCVCTCTDGRAVYYSPKAVLLIFRKREENISTGFTCTAFSTVSTCILQTEWIGMKNCGIWPVT